MHTFLSGTLLSAVVLLTIVSCSGNNPATPVSFDTTVLETATFAGGCFWCVESDMESVPGVREAVSGYSGGHVEDPTYREVAAGGTGHVEAVRVYYDPAIINYERLLDAYWRQFDPTDGGGSFSDRGEQYRPVIYYHNESQRVSAIRSRDALEASGRFDKPLATEILPLKNFYLAEEYHQDYYKKNPLRYNYYRRGSGRDRFLERTWGDDLELKITQE